MENKKLFISLPIPANLINAWYKSFNRLALPQEKIKVVPPDNFHLTVKFLGWLPLDKLLPIISAIKPVAAKTEEFTLTATNTEIFPADATKAPRVLSISFKFSNELQRLFDEIEDTLWKRGLAHKESRRFTPHVTLARVKRAAKQEEFSDFSQWKIAGQFTVAGFQLMESVAGKHGPEYYVLEHFDF